MTGRAGQIVKSYFLYCLNAFHSCGYCIWASPYCWLLSCYSAETLSWTFCEPAMRSKAGIVHFLTRRQASEDSQAQETLDTCFNWIWNSRNKTGRPFNGLGMNGIKTKPSSSKWKDMLNRTEHRQKLFLWTAREWNTKYVFYEHIRSFLLNVTLVWLLSPLGSRTLLGS